MQDSRASGQTGAMELLQSICRALRADMVLHGEIRAEGRLSCTINRQLWNDWAEAIDMPSATPPAIPDSPFEIRYHNAIPGWCKLIGLEIRAIHECEGGGFMVRKDQAEMILRALRAVLPALSPPAIGDGEMREILREQIYSRGKATEDRIKWYDESALAAMRRIAERAGASDLWRSFQHDEPGNIMEQPWDGQTVIIAVMPDGVVGEAYYDHERKDWNWANTHWTDATGDIIRYPTHWQPLPEPPVALHTDEKKGG